MIRACLDTNILISGLISSKGAPHEIFSALRRRDFVLITSLEILQEIEEVLDYPRVRKACKLTPEQIKGSIKLARKYSYKCRSVSNLQIIEADPDDNKFLHAAIKGNAGYIVSGDKHLLDIRSFQGISIVTARQFIETLKERTDSP